MHPSICPRFPPFSFHHHVSTCTPQPASGLHQGRKAPGAKSKSTHTLTLSTHPPLGAVWGLPLIRLSQ
eukprot:1159338-Pelagomonas_calceolata.AAC.26